MSCGSDSRWIDQRRAADLVGALQRLVVGGGCSRGVYVRAAIAKMIFMRFSTRAARAASGSIMRGRVFGGQCVGSERVTFRPALSTVAFSHACSKRSEIPALTPAPLPTGEGFSCRAADAALSLRHEPFGASQTLPTRRWNCQRTSRTARRIAPGGAQVRFDQRDRVLTERLDVTLRRGPRAQVGEQVIDGP